VIPKRRKSGSNLLIPVYRHRAGLRHCGGPGRAGPAMSGLFVEPFPLDFWKLEKSFVLTPHCDAVRRLLSLKRLIRQIRPMSPYHGYACFTVITFLVISSPALSASLNEDARRCSSLPCFIQVHSGLFIVAVIHAARRRHSRSESPEIPGRIVFFITAVGRSPPSSGPLTCSHR
jgi:hypothetical protein